MAEKREPTLNPYYSETAQEAPAYPSIGVPVPYPGASHVQFNEEALEPSQQVPDNNQAPQKAKLTYQKAAMI